MTISLSSSLLLVGTATGILQIFDIASHQPLRNFSTHKGFSITHIQTMLKPPDLIGHVSLSLNVGSAADPRETIPVRPVAPFQRMRDPKTREAHEVVMMLPTSASVCFCDCCVVRVMLTLSSCYVEILNVVLRISHGGAHQRSVDVCSTQWVAIRTNWGFFTNTSGGPRNRGHKAARAACESKSHQ